jgi:hypothetical protein
MSFLSVQHNVMSAKKCAEERTFGASTAPTRFPNEMSSARAQADPPPPWERGIGMAKAVVRGTQEARTPRRALLDVIFLTSRPAHVQDETSVANVAPRTHARTHKQKTPPPFRRTHRKRPVSKRGISGGGPHAYGCGCGRSYKDPSPWVRMTMGQSSSSITDTTSHNKDIVFGRTLLLAG